MNNNNYNWIDNPTEAHVAEYNPDILNECLMHLKYNNNTHLNTTVFSFNSGNVDSNGNADLIEAHLSTNLVYTQPGTYTINIGESGNYDVIVIGGGAGGAWGMNTYGIRSSSSGGSGAVFIGNIYIPAGIYTCTVGQGGLPAGHGGYGSAGETTSISGIISASGGSQGAFASWGTTALSYGGTVTSYTTINSTTINSEGNNGCTTFNEGSSGGASLYNGFGKGGDAGTDFANQGSSGFLSISMRGESYINYKIGGIYQKLKGTLATGEQITINGLNSDDADNLENGTYIKFVGIDGSSELLKTNLFIQSQSPDASVEDVWFNTSIEPPVLIQWNGNEWTPFNKIPLGSFTVENCAITSYKTFPYNQNSYHLNRKSPCAKPSGYFLDLILPATGSSIIAPLNGYIELSALMANSLQIYNLSRNTFWHAISNQNNGSCSVYIPCQKGDLIQIYYDISEFRWFRCYADEGSI